MWHAFGRCLSLAIFLIAILCESAHAQKALTWQEVRTKFEAENQTLQAGQFGVDEVSSSGNDCLLTPKS